MARTQKTIKKEDGTGYVWRSVDVAERLRRYQLGQKLVRSGGSSFEWRWSCSACGYWRLYASTDEMRAILDGVDATGPMPSFHECLAVARRESLVDLYVGEGEDVEDSEQESVPATEPRTPVDDGPIEQPAHFLPPLEPPFLTTTGEPASKCACGYWHTTHACFLPNCKAAEEFRRGEYCHRCRSPKCPKLMKPVSLGWKSSGQ